MPVTKIYRHLAGDDQLLNNFNQLVFADSRLLDQFFEWDAVEAPGALIEINDYC